MDDRELEVRLRARLHERFDAAQPTPELAAGVRQVIAARPGPVGLASLRTRRPTLGWAPVAAVALVALIAVAGIGVGALLGPGDQRPTPTPGSSSVRTTDRWFLTLPEREVTPTRADIDAATEVLVTRLQALGVQPIVEGTDPGVAFKVPPHGATDDAIRALLAAVGEIELVPLPPEDYGQFGEGRVKAVVGEPLPTDPPVLFGWDGITAVSLGEQEGDALPPLLFTLNDSGRATFASWSAAHVDETVAILVDGRVALLPTVNVPIPGGEILVSPGMDPGDPGARDRYEATAAVLIGGRLPLAFGDATSPAIVPVEDVIAATQRKLPDANPLIWHLDAISQRGQWVPVWLVTFGGQFSAGCTPGPGRPCVTFTRLIETVDASNGVPIEAEYQSIPGSRTQ